MTRSALILAALCAACTPNLTTDFVGEWSLSSGQKQEDCGPGLQKTLPLSPGTIEASIAAESHESVRIAWRSYYLGQLRGSCDMVGTTEDGVRLQLLSRVCAVATPPLSIIDGDLLVTESRALTMRWLADAAAGAGTCRQTWDAVLVRK